MIVDKQDYILEINMVLGDRDTYVPLRNSPTISFKRELKKLVNGTISRSF